MKCVAGGRKCEIQADLELKGSGLLEMRVNRVKRK
jgi:hypothetical protein